MHSLFEGTDLWQRAKCQQRVQSQHGGADGRFVPSHEEANCRRDQDFSDSCAAQPHTCSTLLCSCTCLVSAAPWSNALLTALAQHPASQTPCFGSGTVQNSPASISCSLSLYSSSQGCQPPDSVSQRCFGPFLLEPCGMAKTWPHLSPAAWTSPPRPTCKGQSVLLLQEPSRSPRVIVSLLARMEHWVLSTLWESTCGEGVKSTFLQLSSEKRGSQARIWAAGGFFIAGSSFGTPP